MWNDKNLIDILEKGGVVIMPTDTLYGMVGQAQNPAVVERIYTLRKRSPDKPCIILIGEIGELEKFSINLSKKQKNVIKNFSVPTSFILDCLDGKFSYLHRGTKTLAFRVPAPQSLRDLLLKVEPLIAPSANPEGLFPAQNINEARKYFGNAVDLYVDGGDITNKASKVVKLHKDGSVTMLRS
ncbi:MAG: L-threonylcarbamoyladenylate synthase [bacterium]